MMTTTRIPRPLPALGLGLTLLLGSPLTASAQNPAAGGAPQPLPIRPSSPRPDPILTPRIVSPNEVAALKGIDSPLVRDALAITDPGERSLAMVRIARTSIFLGRPDLGHEAILQAAREAPNVEGETVRDQRLISVVQGALALAEEHMREVAIVPVDPGQGGIVLPAPLTSDRQTNLLRGQEEWELAFRVAFLIRNRSSRTEMLYRVVEGEAVGSSAVVREPFRLAGTRPDPSKLPPNLRKFSDLLLQDAIRHAVQIERPVWRDRALVSVASNAASSGQFARALEAARRIPQPEIRTDALLRVAENQTLFDRPVDATETYAETARTVASVPDDDPRETLVGVLIDSLISFGRFDDARACTVLYSVETNRPIALAAVAESQGRRELAVSARKWIAEEPSPEIRALLYRKLNDGILAAIERRRSSDISIRPVQ